MLYFSRRGSFSLNGVLFFYFITKINLGGTILKMFMLKSILSIVVNIYCTKNEVSHSQGFFSNMISFLTENFFFCAGTCTLLNPNFISDIATVFATKKTKHKPLILRYPKAQCFSVLLTSTLKMKVSSFFRSKKIKA